MDQHELEEQVEALIDAKGLDNLVDAIEAVCHEKAEHLASNWGDHSSAKYWRHDAKEFSKLRDALDVPAYCY